MVSTFIPLEMAAHNYVRSRLFDKPIKNLFTLPQFEKIPHVFYKIDEIDGIEEDYLKEVRQSEV